MEDMVKESTRKYLRITFAVAKVMDDMSGWTWMQVVRVRRGTSTSTSTDRGHVERIMLCFNDENTVLFSKQVTRKWTKTGDDEVQRNLPN